MVWELGGRSYPFALAGGLRGEREGDRLTNVILAERLTPHTLAMRITLQLANI